MAWTKDMDKTALKINADSIMNTFAYFDRNYKYWQEIRMTPSGEQEYQQRFLKRVQYERRKLTNGKGE